MRTRHFTLRYTLAVALPLVSLSACRHNQYAYNPPTTASILPLKTLRLYETGVGYFERMGSASGDDTGLPVPAGHLDDALKTLVVLSQDRDTRIQGLEFSSSVSRGMGRALAGLTPGGDGSIGYKELLQSLRGATIEVRNALGVPVVGRLIDVLGTETPEQADSVDSSAGEAKSAEKKADDKPAATPEKIVPEKIHELVLLLLTEKGELRRISTGKIAAVRPLDPLFAARLGAALDATSQRGAQSQRVLRLLTRNGGPVTLGYIAETPLFRVTYRLVLSEPQKGQPPAAILQGWALLHNDTDENWKGVKLHLVSGRPDSFLFPIAAPRYSRRPLITPENELSTVPQLLGNTADTLWGDHVEDSYGAGGLGLTGTGMGGGGTGEGTIGLGSIGTVGHGAGVGSGGESQSSLLQVGNLAPLAKASGTESGALFTYSLAEELDLRAHSSALVPFVQEGLEAEAITWLSRLGAPMRAGVRLTNSTRQTLPAGPVAVYSDGGLAGESAMPRMKPGERRFVQYGEELDVELTKVRSVVKEEPQRLTFDHDRFEEHFLRKADTLYRLENRSDRARTLYYEIKLVANAQVQGTDRVDFDSETKLPVAVFELQPHSKVERPVSTVEGVAQSTDIRMLSAARLSELAAANGLPQNERTIVAEAALRQKELEEAHKELEKTRVEIGKSEKDVERLREHLKAMSHDAASGGAQSPIVKRVLDNEDKLTTLSRKLDTLESDEDRRRELVRKVLERLPKRTDKK